MLDFRLAGFRILVEEGFGGQDHAVQAEAALGGLLIDEGLLNRVGFFGGAEAFEGHDFLAA